MQILKREQKKNQRRNAQEGKVATGDTDFSDADEVLNDESEDMDSNDEGELDQSFDDSDLQNKDPGKKQSVI